ncbi:hypothetical protein AURANDRAFT_77857, partial [Aureococcus anophagefferens]
HAVLRHPRRGGRGDGHRVPRRRLHPRPGRGGGPRPPLLVPRGRLLVVLRQGHGRRDRPVGPVVPRRRPDGRRLRAHVRRLPGVGLHDHHARRGGALLSA